MNAKKSAAFAFEEDEWPEDEDLAREKWVQMTGCSCEDKVIEEDQPEKDKKAR